MLQISATVIPEILAETPQTLCLTALNILKFRPLYLNIIITALFSESISPRDMTFSIALIFAKFFSCS